MNKTKTWLGSLLLANAIFILVLAVTVSAITQNLLFTVTNALSALNLFTLAFLMYRFLIQRR